MVILYTILAGRYVKEHPLVHEEIKEIFPMFAANVFRHIINIIQPKKSINGYLYLTSVDQGSTIK